MPPRLDGPPTQVSPRKGADIQKSLEATGINCSLVVTRYNLIGHSPSQELRHVFTTVLSTHCSLLTAQYNNASRCCLGLGTCGLVRDIFAPVY